MVNFLVMMPTILLSGFMFPISSMPVAFQWLTLLNPVRHYLQVVRAIFLKGAGFAPSGRISWRFSEWESRSWSSRRGG